MNNRLSKIKQLYDDHLAQSFPKDYRGVEIKGVELILLDADIAGCVSSFLGSQSLDVEKIKILKVCKKELSTVVLELSDETRNYFLRLNEMINLVLDETN